MFICPALDTPRKQLHIAVQNALEKWKLPFSSLQVDFKRKMTGYSRKISFERADQKLPQSRISMLAEDFWKANSHKANVPRAAFETELRKALTENQHMVSLTEAQSLCKTPLLER